MGFIGSKPLLELFWVDSRMDCLYRINLRRFIEEKWVRMAKSAIFWAEPASGTGTHYAEEKWYRYQSKWYGYPSTMKVWYRYQSKWYRYPLTGEDWYQY